MLDLVIAGIPYRTTYVLLFVLGILLIVEILIFAILLLRSRNSRKRELVGITLDTAIVKRKFAVGNEFDCSGLIVQANYSVEPSSVNITDYVVVSEDELNDVKSQGELDGCYVVKPDMNEAGKTIVTVLYLDKTSVYSIEVNEAVEEELTKSAEELTSAAEALSEVEPVEAVDSSHKPTIIVEDSAKVIYNKSFMARLIQSSDEVKQWYSKLKNELLSYKKVKARTSWKKETFRRGRVVVARMCFRGKTMCLYLPLNAADFNESKYHLEDVSRVMSNVDTPAMYRLRSARRIKYATELIAMSMEKLGLERKERVAEDFYMPYEGMAELINKGLVKRKIKAVDDEAELLLSTSQDR